MLPLVAAFCMQGHSACLVVQPSGTVTRATAASSRNGPAARIVVAVRLNFFVDHVPEDKNCLSLLSGIERRSRKLHPIKNIFDSHEMKNAADSRVLKQLL